MGRGKVEKWRFDRQLGSLIVKMWYPDGFPPESRAAVAAKKFRAATEFEEVRDGSRRLEPSFELEAGLRRYILRQFGVFVREACKLGKKGIWTVDDVETAALEFLRGATSEARFSKGYDKYGREFGCSWISNWGSIEPEVQRQFERSDEWRQFQAALLGAGGASVSGRREDCEPTTRQTNPNWWRLFCFVAIRNQALV